jgi:Gluconate 2-dehydrogenase subunit 3
MLTRRQLIRVVGGAAALATLPLGCGDNLPPPGPFSNAQRRALGAFADAIIPPDADPGGKALGAVRYIERLLAAFDVTPPAIFADGPYSGRAPFPDGTMVPSDFSRFVELDRVTEAAWRLRILGGPDSPSLFDQIASGLDAAIEVSGEHIDELGAEDLADLFNGQDDEWKSLMIELVTEAAFAAPEYGGNIGLAGWRLCHFEGDRQPLGYSDAEVSMANPDADPAPLDAEITDLMKIVAAFLGGRVA